MYSFSTWEKKPGRKNVSIRIKRGVFLTFYLRLQHLPVSPDNWNIIVCAVQWNTGNWYALIVVQRWKGLVFRFDISRWEYVWILLIYFSCLIEIYLKNFNKWFKHFAWNKRFLIFQIMNYAQSLSRLVEESRIKKISGYAHSHSPSYCYYRLRDGHYFVQNMTDTV